MDSYRAVALAEGFEEGSEAEVLEAWQYLVDSGMAWTLQGWFGRTAASLIKQGVIHAKDYRNAPSPEQGVIKPDFDNGSE